jgi:hypothetical protein
VQLAADTSQAGPLFDVIRLRQTTRSVYDGRPVPIAELDTLQSLPLEPGISGRFLSAQTEMETALEYINAGNLCQYAVPRWLGRMFVGGTKPQQQADADA